MNTVDLRSDTVTRPTAAMRQAIAVAPVGDDHLDGDPTTRALEQRVASVLGKEAALFFPTGTMANQAAVLVHSQPGTELLLDADSHIVNLTGAGVAAFAGVQMRFIVPTTRTVSAADIKRTVRPPSKYSPRASLVLVENTHNTGGGAVTSLDDLREIGNATRELGIPLHLDGARLWNVETATGVAVSRFAECADTVMVSFSKGLGAPVGAALAGTAAAIEHAWHARKRLGGALRQSGIIAAGALFGLENHRDRLSEDHANARRFAAALEGIKGIRVIAPDTNIVMIDLSPPLTAPDVASRAQADGLRIAVWSPTRLRVVTHLDASTDDVDRAATILRGVLERG
jgi:threonine aldolase